MPVDLHLDGAVGELVLNRPEKLNAMHALLAARIRERLEEAQRGAEAGEIRCLIVRGEGRAFCAGRDLADAQPGEDAGAILRDTFNPLMLQMADFPAPTIAAVQGACLGTGLGLAMACDLIYAAHDAKVGSPFARIGAVLDSGGHAAFVQRVGPHRALELIYTGRLLSGEEAAAWGLVNGSAPPDALLDHVRRLARSIAAGPTAAFRASKGLVRRIVDDGLGLDAVLAAEAEAQGRAAQTADYAEGIAAFIEKRTPRFTGR
jgi:enoyl-CoA hydratase/carnithine racemase